ncbi:homeobox leucine zipper protein [Actinidia rufa]|uniref:Homeobox leucine zipper protein n=1 Tax=Actinidia rufa TaxID=165716 RepID=A0A7J0HCU3_9ERIC|nr:homeobox leucine zipper protein [Actinidia rufa]
MPPRRGRGRRGAAEPKDRVDRIERILEGLVQVVHDVHNNNNHDEAPQQPAMPMPGAGAMPRTTIKQFQFLEVFNEEYFSEMVRDQKIQEFLNLKQGNMIVVVYNAKFMELSRYAPHIVSTDLARREEAVAAAAVAELEATRSHEGHMVRVVAGCCM